MQFCARYLCGNSKTHKHDKMPKVCKYRVEDVSSIIDYFSRYIRLPISLIVQPSAFEWQRVGAKEWKKISSPSTDSIFHSTIRKAINLPMIFDGNLKQSQQPGLRIGFDSINPFNNAAWIQSHPLFYKGVCRLGAIDAFCPKLDPIELLLSKL